MAEEKAKITRAYVEHSLGNRNIAGVHPLIDNYLLAGGCSFKTYQS
jgi:hypothetical protein